MFHAYLISTKGWKDKYAKFQGWEDLFIWKPITRTTTLVTCEVMDGYKEGKNRYLQGGVTQQTPWK
jgi:hypothetical protein